MAHGTGRRGPQWRQQTWQGSYQKIVLRQGVTLRGQQLQRVCHVANQAAAMTPDRHTNRVAGAAMAPSRAAAGQRLQVAVQAGKTVPPLCPSP